MLLSLYNSISKTLGKEDQRREKTVRLYLKEVFSFDAKHHGIICCVTARLERMRMPRFLNRSFTRSFNERNDYPTP